MNCRNIYLLRFFMINSLFVLIIFLMQLKKDILYLQWPLSMKYNVTYDAERMEVSILVTIIICFAKNVISHES